MSAKAFRTHGMILGVFLVLALGVAGCSGGSGGDLVASGLGASFLESGTGSAPDMVRLTGNPLNDQVTVRVVIGGPTTSSDLYSFAFDLVLGDTTVAEYVSGSASFGSALTLSGGQTSQVLAVQNGDRVTVGVTKVGGGSGNGVGSGEPAIVQLVFRLLKAGSTSLTIEGSPPFDPAALDSLGNPVGSVAFDAASATLVGS